MSAAESDNRARKLAGEIVRHTLDMLVNGYNSVQKTLPRAVFSNYLRAYCYISELLCQLVQRFLVASNDRAFSMNIETIMHAISPQNYSILDRPRAMFAVFCWTLLHLCSCSKHPFSDWRYSLLVVVTLLQNRQIIGKKLGEFEFTHSVVLLPLGRHSRS